tara:strand:- start:4090 stop:5655 length:1566 start_codon:yes stop_codon:yes gene_type:complete
MDNKDIKEEDEIIEAASAYNYDKDIEEEENEVSVDDFDKKVEPQEAKDEPRSSGKFKKIFGILLGLVVLFIIISAGVKILGGMFGSDTVIARVDGLTITESELVTKYALVPSLFRPGVTPFILLNQSIIEAMLYREATREGYVTSNDELETHFQNLLAQLGTDEEGYTTQLEAANLTKEKIYDVYRQRLTIGKFLNATIMAASTVSDQEIASFYDENTDQFNTDEQVRAAHILVATEEDALTVLEEINNGVDFGQLAQTYSLDTGSGSRGGDLGYFSREDMVAEFSTLAFSMGVGDVSQPVQTQFGYHIIYVLDTKDAGLPSLPEVEATIREVLLAEKQQVGLGTYISGLYMEADIEILHADFEGFPLVGDVVDQVAEMVDSVIDDVDEHDEAMEEVIEEVEEVPVEVLPPVEVPVEEIIIPVVEEPVVQESTNFCDGLSDDSVIFYYASWCSVCNEVLDYVRDRQVEENIVIIEESSLYDSCVDDLIQPGLPNVVCVGSGEVLKGSVTEGSVENFLGECS